ncbi:MAG: hypothetical protein Q9228_002918 [Teloschistes exilis]
MDIAVLKPYTMRYSMEDVEMPKMLKMLNFVRLLHTSDVRAVIPGPTPGRAGLANKPPPLRPQCPAE